MGIMSLNRLQQIQKRFYDLGWTSHSSKRFGEKCLAHAQTIQKPALKLAFTAFANYVIAHPEYCYRDYKPTTAKVGWSTKWDVAPIVTEILKAMVDEPNALRLLKENLKEHFPTIEEALWQKTLAP